MEFTDKRNHWKYTVDILSSKVKVQVVKHTRTVIVNRQYYHLIKMKHKDSSNHNCMYSVFLRHETQHRKNPKTFSL